MEVLAGVLGPEHLPQSHGVAVAELSLEPDEEPTETEVKVSTLFALQIIVKGWVNMLQNRCQII